MSAPAERLERALDVALDALRLIDGDCEKVSRGYPRCSTGRSGYTRGAEYDGWCEPCVAHDALHQIMDGGFPAPSWHDILTGQRDAAQRQAERVGAVATHLYESWDQLRNSAERVLRIPLETPETLRHLNEGATS